RRCNRPALIERRPESRSRLSPPVRADSPAAAEACAIQILRGGERRSGLRAADQRRSTMDVANRCGLRTRDGRQRRQREPDDDEGADDAKPQFFGRCDRKAGGLELMRSLECVRKHGDLAIGLLLSCATDTPDIRKNSIPNPADGYKCDVKR